ncbi:MAG: hypothetical protein JW745_05620, partial [Sedimentisphaerales bacterium]|nr:hypothetical protein [Sedimentisphaerales bacterium]
GINRANALEDLPAGDYSAFTFNSELNDSEPILIRRATGSVAGDDIRIRVGESNWNTSHVLGGANNTTIDGVTVSSANGIDLAHGYYKLDLTYTRGDGLKTIEIDDIDWSEFGGIDSVVVTDQGNVTILDYDDNSISLLIDTDNGIGSAAVFFGTTVDVLRPGLGYTSATPVFKSSSMLTGTAGLYGLIREDGDYVLRVGMDFTSSLYSYRESSQGGIYNYTGYYGVIPTTPLEYDLTVCAFNDGDSDFGQVEISDDSFIYYGGMPDDAAVDLSASTTHWTADERLEDVYRFTRGTNPYGMIAKGEFITPGQAGSITVNSDLAVITDVDVYSVQLTEGQKLSVDLRSLYNSAVEGVEFAIGVYNSDLESVATILAGGDDIALINGEADRHYTVQAVNEINGVTIDPMESVNGTLTGTYYVVVSLMDYYAGEIAFDDSTYYSLTLTTSEGGADKIKTVASPQLVYLSFGDKNTGENLTAEYLEESLAGISYGDISDRPAFSLSDFPYLPASFNYDANGDGVENEVQDVTWDYMVERITEQVCAVYQEALDDPTTPEREDQELIYITNDYSEVDRIEHSTVVIGGDFSMPGLMGIAQTVDRHNTDRSDMACVGSTAIGEYTATYMNSSSPEENVDRAVNAIASTTIHELAHILGLEHSTEVNPDLTTPIDSAALYLADNVMNYNSSAVDMSAIRFETRNSMASAARGIFSYTVNQPGFQNEIDALLRNLGTVPPVM